MGLFIFFRVQEKRTKGKRPVPPFILRVAPSVGARGSSLRSDKPLRRVDARHEAMGKGAKILFV
jgi:hypothetical protein